MATTTTTGLPIPTSGDAPNVPSDLATLGTALDKTTVPLFASTGARDTAYGITPFKMCVVGASVDAGIWYVRRSGAFHVVNDLDQLITVPQTSFTPVVTASTTNPTGYTATGQYSVANGEANYIFNIVFGSSVGVGTYAVSLPVAVGTNWLAAFGGAGSTTGIGLGTVKVGSSVTQGQWGPFSGTTMRLYVESSFSAITSVTNTVPFAIATGSILYGSVSYGVT